MAPPPDETPRVDPESTETLQDALRRVGDEDSIQSLNMQARALTKAEVTNLLNAKFTEADDEIMVATIASIANLAKARLKAGKSVLPWEMLSGLELAQDNMEGGIW